MGFTCVTMLCHAGRVDIECSKYALQRLMVGNRIAINSPIQREHIVFHKLYIVLHVIILEHTILVPENNLMICTLETVPRKGLGANDGPHNGNFARKMFEGD